MNSRYVLLLIQGQIVSLEDNIESTSTSINSLSGSISQPKSRLLSLEAEKSALHATLATLDTSLDTLTLRLSKADSLRRQRLDVLEERLRGYRGRDEMFGEKNRLRVRLATLMAELGRVGIRIEVEQRVRDMLGEEPVPANGGSRGSLGPNNSRNGN